MLWSLVFGKEQVRSRLTGMQSVALLDLKHEDASSDPKLSILSGYYHLKYSMSRTVRKAV